ncbi:hypothetical protein CAPTEDRAFT_216654 [Capitella teleta]|uniref:Neurotransmitter-gated ion-channel ligand-binding domain-containing protein n=1 Tax=Capitella teleta TaxID=283909 RepID=R7U5D0_CAPTE|nr:hypothetical protein CAPTEDRAFT_216654 [Capitella teleta]|eukprot:ELU01184.1 hypothetical protein CAPTEDRAFT_216654 [Capitella teleta]
MKAELQPSVFDQLLDSLLEGYNKHLRPGMGGPPLEIRTNILIRSMGPISEEEMMFSMDCYFRQEWQDPRLAFVPMGDLDIIRPSIKMLDDIWKPDTFFLNGQDSYLHTITYSNKLFRIYNKGDILYSQRLTIKSSCPMKLQKYPLDSQSCPLFLGSYGYTRQDIVYKWQDMQDGKKPVQIHEGISMAQFRLTGFEYGNKTLDENHGLGARRVLSVDFELQREIGYYLLQIYLPCYLIVVISWVSFFINREATPARVTLGITTLLTTSTIALTGREGIPKVTYSTALDIYLLMCFWFVFAALVEYAGVNYFTKTGSKEFIEESDEIIFNEFAAWISIACNIETFGARISETNDPVSKIDSMSRIIFPFVFTCLNVLYWAGFIYYF